MSTGTVYLLHFSAPYRHARHYTGWTDDLPARLTAHAAGRGARPGSPSPSLGPGRVAGSSSARSRTPGVRCGTARCAPRIR
jgi:hypothetical protein